MSGPHAPAPLTRAELSTLSRALLVQQRNLREGGSISSVVAEASLRETDPSDEGSENREQDEALAMSLHDRRLLGEVNAALDRIKAGAYGTSELSGEPIGYARLSAVPWARLTATEQEEHDRVGRSEPSEPAP
jgi:DnaK suppressor protein